MSAVNPTMSVNMTATSRRSSRSAIGSPRCHCTMRAARKWHLRAPVDRLKASRSTPCPRVGVGMPFNACWESKASRRRRRSLLCRRSRQAGAMLQWD
jgi:hypothetical protein